MFTKMKVVRCYLNKLRTPDKVWNPEFIRDKAILLICVFTFCISLSAFSAEKKDIAVTEQIKDKQGRVVANVNWTESFITAKGVGVPMASAKSPAQGKATARRAAVVDAQRNLLEIIKGVRISSETIVKDLMVESDTIKTSVEGIVKGASVIDEKEKDDGSYEVTLSIKIFQQSSLEAPAPVEEQKETPRESLKKEKKQIVKKQDKKASADTLASIFQSIIIPKEEPAKKTKEKEMPVKPSHIEKDNYTGLVIDAAGLGVKPAMSPKIFDESGREIYGTMQVDPDFVIQTGIVGYLHNLEDAKKAPRVKDNPLTVKGIGKKGAFNADVTINNEDADKIRLENEKSKFLESMRVMIVF